MGYFPKSKASLVSSGFDFALPHIGAKMWIIHKDGLFTFTAEHINADVQLDTKFVDVLGEHRKIESVYKILPNFEKSVKKEALFMEQQRIAWLDPNEETGDANTKRKTVLADLTYYISEETTNAGNKIPASTRCGED
ncbi:hypothetical protein Ddc_11847 [Ditylenchus destructor]|nr:hypothetical protein Ddc_11847 [Ditylenchus destructor]